MVGGALLAQNLDRVTVGVLLGRVGLRVRPGSNERASAVALFAQAGLVGAADLGTQAAFQVQGRTTVLPSLGATFGAGVRVRLPLGSGAAFLEASALRTFLDTEVIMEAEPADGGFASFWVFPLALGFAPG